jgi:SAM-dependent methyltransferase
MSTEIDYDADYAKQQIDRSNSPLRRFVKGFYLRNLLTDVDGPTIDFGCGAGQVLNLLPKGSVGLEVNKSLVKALVKKDLNVQLYEPEDDKLSFESLQVDHYKTFVMSHVLEHFDNAQEGLKDILNSCKRLGVRKIIIIVPTKKGFDFDSTHRTFIDLEFIKNHDLSEYGGYKLEKTSYFPLDTIKLGDYLTFHELKIVYSAA